MPPKPLYTFYWSGDMVFINKISCDSILLLLSIPIRENLYPVRRSHNSVRRRLLPFTNRSDQLGVWFVGKDAICLLNKDLAGWVIPNADVQFLLSQSMKYQFEVALVGRAWHHPLKQCQQIC